MFESTFQSFEEATDRAASAGRLAALREELARQQLDGFVVPRADRHQGEYVPACEERLAWLTGFPGSAGLAVVLEAQAAIFVDGRYALAVVDQVDTAVFTPVPLTREKPEDWIARNLGTGKLGYDPWLTTPAQARLLERAVKTAGGTLVAVGSNPIDQVWSDRPAPPRGAVTLHPRKLAGETAERKLARVAASLGEADALLVSDPHAVAWLFNIRGADVHHTPLPLAFALVPKQSYPTLFVEADKVGAREHKALSKLAALAEPGTLETVLDALGKAGKRVLFDQATAPARLTAGLEAAGGKAVVGTDPIALMKARKNASELAGTRAAHLRDGAAVTRFLHWLAETAKPGKLTEIDAARALEAFRHEAGQPAGGLKDISFPSISAAGPHAASPHYKLTAASNAPLERGIYLIDSGAQYADGTTDITRTVAIGRPSAEMRDRFTRVLKGHIAIATALFPKGTSGAQIDALARLPLWRSGLDFDHGTGHGVGAYLSVHEGPQRIAKTGTTALEPGMILSNEPGYYKAGEYGIRIENLVVVEAREVKGGDREMLGFETITFAPIDRALIDVRLLERDERAWLDAYHAQVRRLIGPRVPPATRRWLTEATRKL